MEKTKFAVVLVLAITSHASAASTLLQGSQITVGIDNAGYLINSAEGYGIDYTEGDGSDGRDFLLDLDYGWEGYSIGVGYNIFSVSPDFVYPDIYSPATDSTPGSMNAVTTGTAYYTEPELGNTVSYHEMGLSFVQNVSVSGNSSVIDFEVVLTNETNSSLSDIVYARYLDPDQDWFEYGTHNTTNTVLSESFVEAAGVDPDWTIAIRSTSEYPQNASEAFPGIDGPYTLLGWDEGSFGSLFDNTGDFSIAMAWDIGTLGAGESATIDFQYVIGQGQELDPGQCAVVPVPGAFVLGSIGIGFVTLLRRRKFI